ncbi:MAG TPA: putative baseplate assembly protein, partial [Kofleriaceae bacterium]
MPIESPQLDDLRYDRVVEELLRRIPVHTPEWTDHNDSDPGITLIQLFAYLTEQIGWRLNRVPEKTHIELLKLLGIRLEAARAAKTHVAFLLAHPAINPGVILDAGSRVARKGSPPILFETDALYDIVPAEPRCIVTTKHPFLWDLLRLDEVGNHEPAPADSDLPPELPAKVTRWMTVAWDGAKPKPIDMPVAPIVLSPPATTGDVLPYVWIGLEHNDLRDAGFLGAAVTMTIQLDDDEQPDPRKTIECEPVGPKAEPAPPPIDWLAYFDEDRQQMLPIPGRIIDATDKLAHSGTIRFTVPIAMGPIEDWANLREKFPPDGPVPDVCKVMTAELILGLPQGPMWDPTTFSTALTNAVDAATAESATVKPAVGHPLDPALRDPAKITSWLRLGPLSPDVLAGKKLRHVGFNVVAMTQAETVRNLILGRSDGRPGQVFRLGHRNVFADSLELAIAESSDPKALLTTWTRTDTLDAAGPFDRVFDLDPEAGAITFGDGQRGRIPPLVPKGGTVVAQRYRHGGGVAGESAVGTITSSLVQITGLAGVVNVVAATGGEDAETLEQAKLRARKELSTRSRAVTADDFEWIALRTPDVRVARAIVVPRRRPLPGTPHAGKTLP